MVPLSFSQPHVASTPQILSLFSKLKYLVFLLWFLVFIRLLAADLSGSLNILTSAIPGTFLLKNDPEIRQLFDFCFRGGLLETATQGSHGTNCLFCCILMWVINGFSDIMSFASMLNTFGGNLLPCTFTLSCFEALLTLLSGVLQLAGGIVSWNVLRVQLYPSLYGGVEENTSGERGYVVDGYT